MTRVLLLLIIFCSISTSSRERVDPYIKKVKDLIEEYSDRNYIEAANKAYRISRQKGTGESNFYLAKSLYNLELSHAASEFLYDAALNGGNVLDEVIRSIKYLVDERPFDWDLIIKDLIGDHLFGVMNSDNADFINYYKGYLAYKDNINKWKVNSFKKIKQFSTYYYKAKYIDIIDDVKKWRITKALGDAEQLARADIKDINFKNEVLQTYARLLFQKKQYYKAFDVYRVISTPPTQSESIFLEKAWTLYYLQDYQAALGNLLSLDAKIFEGFNKPSRFVLQGLIFQRICEYNLALATIKAFRKTYKKVLIDIKERKKINKAPYIMGAFKRHSKVKRLVDFYELLKWEQKKLYEYDGDLDDSGLYKKLLKIYKYKIAEIGEQIRNMKKEVYPLIAGVLLDAEEQINFLEYEVKMDKLKRSKIFLTKEERELYEESIGEEEIKAENAFKWPFEGEFWTDELGTYRVLVKDSCNLGGGM
jgi:hypothetical protein